jgi:hypothetical protein
MWADVGQGAFLPIANVRTDNASFTVFRQRIVELSASGTDSAS